MSLSFLPPVPTEASLQCLLKVSSGPAWENPVSGEDGSELKVLVCWDRRGLGTRAWAVLAAPEAPPPSPSGQCRARCSPGCSPAKFGWSLVRSTCLLWW